MDACVPSTNCKNMMGITESLIQLVNEYYYDLMTWANNVMHTNTNSILSSINNAKAKKGTNNNLFQKQRMHALGDLVSSILKKVGVFITADTYLEDVIRMSIFATGDVSETILFKVFRDDSTVIMKLMPLEVPHKYPLLQQQMQMSPRDLNTFIWDNIEAPNYSLFMKEAWLGCFSQQNLQKYTPAFTCVSDCYLIRGLPINSVKDLNSMIDDYDKSHRHPLRMKDWLDAITNPQTKTRLAQEIYHSVWGCVEMEEIDETLDSMFVAGDPINLSLIFECFYTKLVSAFIGRIIFTDDHFENIGYITVDYSRVYNIKCNGCMYRFIMPPGKMIQFIDLERYVFNFSHYDIFTNAALRTIPDKNLNYSQARINESYSITTHHDKSLTGFLSQYVTATSFEDPEEYEIMHKILNSPFFHDIKTFPSIMDIHMPSKYRGSPVGKYQEYHLDLDDDSLRVITLDQVLGMTSNH